MLIWILLIQFDFLLVLVSDMQFLVRFGSVQGRSWAKPNETLVLGPQNFLKKLHRKKPLKNFFRPPNLSKKNFSWNFLETAYSPLNLGAGPGSVRFKNTE